MNPDNITRASLTFEPVQKVPLFISNIKVFSKYEIYSSKRSGRKIPLLHNSAIHKHALCHINSFSSYGIKSNKLWKISSTKNLVNVSHILSILFAAD